MQDFLRIMLFRLGTGLGLMLPFTGCPADSSGGMAASVPVETVPMPDAEILQPQRIASFDLKVVPECSAFVASKKFPGVFWTLSDSENTPHIVAMNASGVIIKPNGTDEKYRGIEISGVKNYDWESLTLDDSGNLIIGDIGNNKSDRKNLALLTFPEPDPRVVRMTPAKKIAVSYEDQKDFPDKGKRFDCEAIFFWNDAIYALTKRRMDTWTVLYRLEIQPNGTGIFRAVTSFNSQGLVTDAAVSADKKSLAILTYFGVWIFKLPESGNNPLSGEAWHRKLVFPLKSSQVEAVSFLDEKTLIIGSEQGDIYKVEIAELVKAR